MKKSMIVLLLPLFLVACDHDEYKSEDSYKKDKMMQEDKMNEKMMKEESMEDKEEKMEDTMIEDIIAMEEENALKEESTTADDAEAMMKEEAMIEEEMMEQMDSEESTMEENSMEMMVQVEKYQDYTPELYAELKGKKDFVLFFHASWCPTCVKWEKTMKANLETLPENTVILKADYDTEKDLKKKYGVTSQSTAVMISKDGTTKNQADPSVEAVSSFFSK